MSTTSPNFNLILATSADTVSVTSHVANNFSTLDSLFSIAHTGTGQLKGGLSFTTPTLINPVVSGTISGGVLVTGSTGSFNTITATGGAVTLTTFSIGTYSMPATIGGANTLLTVVTGNANWVAAAPGTGAAQDLSNLAAVVINTSLNTFTGGFVTVNRIISTSGAITGLTSFQATAGTFVGLVTALGTITANVLNVTGGAITAGSLTVGTYALPAAIGATGQVVSVTAGTLSFNAPILAQTTAYVFAIGTTGSAFLGSGDVTIPFNRELVDSATIYDTATFIATVTASGYYQVCLGLCGSQAGASVCVGKVFVVASATNYMVGIITPAATEVWGLSGAIMHRMTSGGTLSALLSMVSGTTTINLTSGGGSFLSIYKIPDI